MDKQEYAEYEAAVKDFFEREGIDSLRSIDNDEPFFSWNRCACCNRPEGGDRELACGYNPTTDELQGDYSVCPDCLYYAEYGRLDDMTMLDVEAD